MRKVVFSLATLASLMFAAPTAYNYEITPTIGGVLPEGNLDLDNQLTYGVRLGINLNSLFSQFELGYDRTNSADYKNTLFDTEFNRYYANVVKEYKMSPESALYALVGLGYEDVKNEQLENKDSMFAQYGGGVKYWVSDNFALKAEVRHAVKFNENNNNLFYSLGFVIPLDAKAAPIIAKQAEPKPAVIEVIAPKDSDGDGVFDDIDQCPNTPQGSVVDAQGCTKIIRLHITFDFDQVSIKKEFLPEIQKVADFMKQNSGYSVVLEGHTDAKGSDAYNQKLSDKRAKAVAKALADFGISNAKISTEAYGEGKPIAPNDTDAGRAENRRVDAKFNK